jgi:CRISPR-associated protein Csb3
MIDFSLEPRNPGEVLAACGLFNLASLRFKAMAEFTPDGHFRLDTPDTLDQLLSLLKPDQMEVAPDLSWVSLSGIHLNWWMREGGRLKLWAGQVNPQNLLEDLLQACDRVHEEAIRDGFLSASVPLTKRFGSDPRSSWVSLDIGYSPNDQGIGAVHTRPFAEVLSIIGLQTFLPKEVDIGVYSYNLWNTMLPLLPARLAFSEVPLSVPGQRYRFNVIKSGWFSVFNFSELED